MGFFKNAKEMFSHRADSCEKKGDQHWAKAKNGEGGHNFAAAKKQYEKAKEVLVLLESFVVPYGTLVSIVVFLGLPKTKPMNFSAKPPANPIIVSYACIRN